MKPTITFPLADKKQNSWRQYMHICVVYTHTFDYSYRDFVY